MSNNSATPGVSDELSRVPESLRGDSPATSFGLEHPVLQACAWHLTQLSRLMAEAAVGEGSCDFAATLARGSAALQSGFSGEAAAAESGRSEMSNSTVDRSRKDGEESGGEEVVQQNKSLVASGSDKPVSREKSVGMVLTGTWSEGDLQNLVRASATKGTMTSSKRLMPWLPRCVASLRSLIGDPRWEIFWAIAILINVAMMMAEQEYLGMIMGNCLGIYTTYGSEEFIDRWWPHAESIFLIGEVVFAMLFTLELSLVCFTDLMSMFLQEVRGESEKKPFWRDWLDLLDIVVVACADLYLVQSFMMAEGEDPLPFSVSALRMLRLAKLMRLVRLLRMVRALDPMVMLTCALKGSLEAFLASFIVLFLFATLPALALTAVTRDFYLKDANRQMSVVQQEQLFQYFGTYTRSWVTMLELALANWPTVTRFLMEELHEGFGVFCVVYKLTVGFVVINVINGVFIKACFTVADNDDIMLARNKKRQLQQHRDKMSRFFHLADKDGNGSLSKDNFRMVLKKRAIRTWLEAMDLNCSDADTLFDMLAGQNGRMTVDQLIGGVAKLKGPARNIDLVRLLSMPMFASVGPARRLPRRKTASSTSLES